MATVWPIDDFLADHGIDGEPTVWRPPAGVLEGLCLPGEDPDAVDVTHLRNVITAGGKKLGAAATRLETSLDTVRYLLETHPPPRPARPPGATPARGVVYCTAKAALPRANIRKGRGSLVNTNPPEMECYAGFLEQTDHHIGRLLIR